MTLGDGLRWLVETCRAGPPEPLARFVGGDPTERQLVAQMVPCSVLDDLSREGLVTSHEQDRVCLTIRCHAFNGLVSITPARQQSGADYVHVNIDSLWLVKLAWEHGTPGDCAAELGTGNGIVAAHLVARYRRVVATDLPGAWMQYAQLTLEANKGRGRPTAVIACDIASALRPRSFDLVVANAPWSPCMPLDADGNVVTFAAGGPTGTELPRRFIRQAASLLRPGGTSITLCLDPRFEDGSRPLLDEASQLSDAGYRVEMRGSEVFDSEVVTLRLRESRLPTLVHARHVAVIVTKPSN